MSGLREAIKKEVVAGIDFISPLDLSRMDWNAVEDVKIDFTTGFDEFLKRSLDVPLSKIALKHAKDTARVISSSETSALKTVRGAIDLTTAAAGGLPFGGE